MSHKTELAAKLAERLTSSLPVTSQHILPPGRKRVCFVYRLIPGMEERVCDFCHEVIDPANYEIVTERSLYSPFVMCSNCTQDQVEARLEYLRWEEEEI